MHAEWRIPFAIIANSVLNVCNVISGSAVTYFPETFPPMDCLMDYWIEPVTMDLLRVSNCMFLQCLVPICLLVCRSVRLSVRPSVCFYVCRTLYTMLLSSDLYETINRHLSHEMHMACTFLGTISRVKVTRVVRIIYFHLEINILIKKHLLIIRTNIFLKITVDTNPTISLPHLNATDCWKWQQSVKCWEQHAGGA